MKRRDFLISSAGAAAALALPTVTLTGCQPDVPKRRIERLDVPEGAPKILIAGGGFDTAFIAYMAGLTGKERPRLCYLPTASADRPEGIQRWHDRCEALDVESHHQVSFINSYRMEQSWEDVFLSMDGIVVSGGNTLNQQAIWRAQGIDEVLREAWNRGIVLGGASAGSLCWFEEGTTDSRPKELTKIECLGFLEGSHSPHYDGESQRRPTYHRLIASGDLKPGWACDNNAGIYFEGTEPTHFVATREDAGVYYVDLVEGEVVETPHETTLIA
jgi:peptidase E